MQIDLSGKSALVTGSTEGIGFAIAEGLHAAGAQVVVNGRTQAKVDAAVSRLGGAARGRAIDLGTPEGTSELIAVDPAFDIVVNNLGIFQPSDFFETPDETWERHSFRDLLPGPRYHLDRRAMEVMPEAGGARVIYADGREEHAELVIGADGIGSVVREAVAGPDSRPRYVGYAIWRGLVPEERVPEIAANQLFERFSFFEMSGSHILGYLVPGADGSIAEGRRRYNWVWYRRFTPAELDEVLTDIDGERRPFSLAPSRVRPEMISVMRADANQLLPPSFAAAVTAESRPFIHAVYDYVPPRMVAGRVALMGDAAFVARPHTAMGVAKAAGDAFALRDALVSTPDMDKALMAYEAARAPVGANIVAYGQRLGRSLA